MESFTNLLTDAFSESTAPPFTFEDLVFDHLESDIKSEEDEESERITEKEEDPLQEVARETTSVLREDVEDLLCMAGNDDSIDNMKNPKAVGVSLINICSNTPEHYTSLESKYTDEDLTPGNCEKDYEEEKLKGLISLSGTSLKSIFEEDSVGVEDQPLALTGSADPQVSNKEPDEVESNEEVTYFGKVHEQGIDDMIKTAAREEDEQESDEEDSSSTSEREIIQEEQFLTENLQEEVENTNRKDLPEASSASPCISLQNLQDLIAEIDGEESIKSIKEFSGEEHQEAGESVADYPSNLSFCTDVEDKEKYKTSNQLKASLFTVDCCSNAENETSQGSAGTEAAGTGSAITLTMNEERKVIGSNETRTKSVLDGTGKQNSESEKETEVDEFYSERSNPDRLFLINSKNNLPVFTMWDSDEVNDSDTEDTKETGTPGAGGNPSPTVEISGYSLVQEDDYQTTPSSYQRYQENKSIMGCNTESYNVSEMVDDAYKKETLNRIKAFYRYYDDDDDSDDEENERPIKVQFCADPLSQVIHYETESSDSDSVSSSTDRDEDLNAADTADGMGTDILKVMPVCDPPKTQKVVTKPDRSHTHPCAGQHKCEGMLNLMLKTALYTLMIILIFWLLVEFPDWHNHVLDYY
ncbi:dentin sialophosphoprotein isoform X2 [Gouania willdenowi]|uniref:dentin sialophosphoprotein isoform X2 n=1 Tax=Gouania willdenowi TaxID=441366 RepID=UPI001056672E|nr:dentin sialophosphoprotein-like isoform X2 [Gouania willdenowi]